MDGISEQTIDSILEVLEWLSKNNYEIIATEEYKGRWDSDEFWERGNKRTPEELFNLWYDEKQKSS